jgi:hypothetical protein
MSTAVPEGKNVARRVIDVTNDATLVEPLSLNSYQQFPPRYYAINTGKRVPVTVWNNDQQRFIKGTIRAVTDSSCLVEYELSAEEQRKLGKKNGHEWSPLKDFRDMIEVTGIDDAEKESPTTTAKTRIYSGRKRFSKAFARICAGRPYQVEKQSNEIRHPENPHKTVKIYTLKNPLSVRIYNHLKHELTEETEEKCMVVAVTADQRLFQIVKNYDVTDKMETLWVPAGEIDPPLFCQEQEENDAI